MTSVQLQLILRMSFTRSLLLHVTPDSCGVAVLHPGEGCAGRFQVFTLILDRRLAVVGALFGMSSIHKSNSHRPID